MKSLMLAVSLFMLSAAAGAADQVDPRLAMDYLTISRMEDMVNATVKEYDEQLFKGAPPEERATFRKFMQDAMGWNATKDQLVELVASIYTKEELEASIAFMKSPLGASMTAKNEEFGKRFAALYAANMQKVIKECYSQSQ